MTTDWSQTPSNVTIVIPLNHKITGKDLSHQITENFIKINIIEQKILKLFDLYSEIDIETSKIVLEDKRIIIYLDKLKQENWPSLEFTGSKNEKNERRKKGEENYMKKIAEIEEKSKEQKKLNEKFVFDKSVQLGDERRKDLNLKKDTEKKQVEKELYDFVNVMDNTSSESEVIKAEAKGIVEEVDTIVSNKNSITNTDNDKTEISEQGLVPQAKKSYTNNEIFTNETQAVTNNSNTAPIRKETEIKVDLTEKLIPHFAARESLAKEPPYPKSKKFNPEKNVVIYKPNISWDMSWKIETQSGLRRKLTIFLRIRIINQQSMHITKPLSNYKITLVLIASFINAISIGQQLTFILVNLN
jgi:hypothetical protein